MKMIFSEPSLFKVPKAQSSVPAGTYLQGHEKPVVTWFDDSTTFKLWNKINLYILICLTIAILRT